MEKGDKRCYRRKLKKQRGRRDREGEGVKWIKKGERGENQEVEKKNKQERKALVYIQNFKLFSVPFHNLFFGILYLKFSLQ